MFRKRALFSLLSGSRGGIAASTEIDSLVASVASLDLVRCPTVGNSMYEGRSLSIYAGVGPVPQASMPFAASALSRPMFGGPTPLASTSGPISPNPSSIQRRGFAQPLFRIHLRKKGIERPRRQGKVLKVILLHVRDRSDPPASPPCSCRPHTSIPHVQDVLDLPNQARLGPAGSIVQVARGYARNYLIPQRLARYWSPATEQELQSLVESGMRRQEELKESDKGDSASKNALLVRPGPAAQLAPPAVLRGRSSAAPTLQALDLIQRLPVVFRRPQDPELGEEAAPATTQQHAVTAEQIAQMAERQLRVSRPPGQDHSVLVAALDWQQQQETALGTGPSQVKIDPRLVDLSEPLKAFGEYTVPLRILVRPGAEEPYNPRLMVHLKKGRRFV